MERDITTNSEGYPRFGSPDAGFGWRLSTHSSGTSGSCVAVGQVPGNAAGPISGRGTILVRDTNDETGLVVVFPAAAWRHFIMHIRENPG